MLSAKYYLCTKIRSCNHPISTPIVRAMHIRIDGEVLVSNSYLIYLASLVPFPYPRPYTPPSPPPSPTPKTKPKKSTPRTHRDLTSSKVLAPGSSNIQPPAQSELTDSLFTGTPSSHISSIIPDRGAAIAGTPDGGKTPETSGCRGDILGSRFPIG